jgi:Domain of unknown function (DUF5606)
MEYNKIIAVTGLPGLYELLSSKSDGAIVRSLDDKTTRFVASRVHNFSHLESIEVYTVRDNVNLVDILQAMEASATKLPDEKDGGELKSYFSKVYPDLDFTRVYSSDLKKMVKWFSVLKANNIEIKLSEEAPEEEGGEEEVVEEKTAAHVKKEKAATHAEKGDHAEKVTHAEKTVKGGKETKTGTAKKEMAPEEEKSKAKKPAAKAEKARAAEKVAVTAKKKAEKKEEPAAEKPKKAAKKK